MVLGASGEPPVLCHPSDYGGRPDSDDSVTALGNQCLLVCCAEIKKKKQAFALVDVWRDDCLHQEAGLYGRVCLSRRLWAEPAGCWLTTESTRRYDVLGRWFKNQR